MPNLAPRNPAVSLVNNQVTTTSTAVAEFFGKRHDHVLRAIDNLMSDIPAEKHLPNFGEVITEYKNGKGGTQQARCYTLTRDGFALLAMGFTGKEAMQWKIAYLEAFNAMEI
mgnify:CR=1 FL=1